MQYIFSLLPLLACPVGMGLMMWFIMRVGKDTTSPGTNRELMNTSGQPQETPYSSEVPNESPQRTPLFKMLLMCLNWKVVAALVGVGVIVRAVAPQFLLGAIPLLIVAACPLSMLFMMRSMQDGGKKTSSPSVQMNEPPAVELTREEQRTELQFRQSRLQQEHEYLARQIAEMESPMTSITSEADAVSQKATRQ